MEKTRIKAILPKPPLPVKAEGGAFGAGHGPEAAPAPAPAPKRRPAVGGADPKRRKSSPGSDDDDGAKGHRPVTSCTFCRQHKIKCNASDNYPAPCLRCDKMQLKCEIDPKFRPKKGSQIQTLKNDVDELKAKIEMLARNEVLLTRALNQHNLNYVQQLQQERNFEPAAEAAEDAAAEAAATAAAMEAGALDAAADAFGTTAQTHLELPLVRSGADSTPTDAAPAAGGLSHAVIAEFVLGGVRLPLAQANALHARFLTKHLPFFPIFELRSATELYHKLQLLFWSVMLTASLLEPTPHLYMLLAALIKQLAVETCWIHTPRLTHVIQALLVLLMWPLPNEKILDDCLYRFIGLAKKLLLQLGLHRGGEFIQDFSRRQVLLGPGGECWRTRLWLAVFFCEHFWLLVLGLPPLITLTDYLLEGARVDVLLPANFRCLILLAIFQCKLVNVMGVLVTSPDGLLEPQNRAASLNILDRELERLRFKLPIDDGLLVELYFLYVKLMICCFAFLPGTPIEDQVRYVLLAYLAATRIVTITLQLISNGTVLLIELPIYVRHLITYLVLLLFKLSLLRYLIDRYVDSARQLIVTVHRLLRNTLLLWKDLQNDILRTARLLENLNIVLLTYPEVFEAGGAAVDGSIILRMRSHLTASLFYDLVWCVHEARRRNLESRKPAAAPAAAAPPPPDRRRPAPLPFYNQITKDDFHTITTTTPNGTTITTLVPTEGALTQARHNAGANEPLEINGIPMAMLEATGSMAERDQVPFAFELESPAPPPPPSGLTPVYDGGVADQITTFLQQQSTGWLNDDNYEDDDFLGWFDMNLPEG